MVRPRLFDRIFPAGLGFGFGLLLATAAATIAQQPGPGPAPSVAGATNCAGLSDAGTGCVTNVGTIATQAANNVALTGGAINGAAIGGTSRAAGSFTAVTVTNGVTATTVKTVATTLTALGSAATAGAGTRAFITDGSTTLILGLGLAAVGSGANLVPVYSDGTNWIVG